MAGQRQVIIEHPNREKASSKTTKAIVTLLLLVSIGLALVVTVGGWDTLEGAKPVLIAYLVIYLVMAYYVTQWNRGVLPVIAALAIILAIFAAVATPEWFDRDKTGFTDPTIDEGVLGLVCAVLAGVQLLLIGFAMQGFAQAWNVEVERVVDDGRGFTGAGTPATA
jgi:hypothetical protein